MIEANRRDDAGAVQGLPRGAAWLVPLHLIVGATTLVVFLVTGAYMRFHDPPVGHLDPGRHLMFTSRHIYILSAALVNLVLGASLRPSSAQWIRLLRILGSVLLVASAILVVAAFVAEPMSNRSRTPVSSFGLYSLFGGSLVHVVAGLWERLRER